MRVGASKPHDVPSVLFTAPSLGNRYFPEIRSCRYIGAILCSAEVTRSPSRTSLAGSTVSSKTGSFQFGPLFWRRGTSVVQAYVRAAASSKTSHTIRTSNFRTTSLQSERISMLSTSDRWSVRYFEGLARRVGMKAIRRQSRTRPAADYVVSVSSTGVSERIPRDGRWLAHRHREGREVYRLPGTARTSMNRWGLADYWLIVEPNEPSRPV